MRVRVRAKKIKESKARHNGQRVNDPNRVILHCSATPDSIKGDPNFDRWGAKDIDEWHKQRGFNKIGYHFVIRRTGEIETGREIAEIGAHCKAMGGNLDSIGICLIGTKLFTPEQMDSLFSLYLQFKSKIPFREWYGHCEFDDDKPNCPGLDMELLRDRLSKL